MIRVATFNLNNIFDRFNFHGALTERVFGTATYRWRLAPNRDVLPPHEDRVDVDEFGQPIIEGVGPVRLELSPRGQLVKPKREAHLNALLNRTDRMNADVLAVQEVENIAALREFNSALDAPYPFLALLEGNDPRFIDVGLLSRLPIGSATSNRWVPDPETPSVFLFSRDFMAVEILKSDRSSVLFTIWIAHFKSKFVDPDITDEAEIEKKQDQNSARRKRQVEGAAKLIAARHDVSNDAFIVCGDFNDHPGSDPLAEFESEALKLVDVLEGGPKIDFERPEGEGPRISNREDEPPDENWTHRHQVSRAPDKFERLDHLLVSKVLKDKIENARIQRRTHWGKQHAGSDHDPIYVDLDLQP
ncbi:MAG: endonuclease/exonuclease/phosphatase family protein [Pseudomonadota bacterium]